MQLQQQLQTSTAAGALPLVTDPAPSVMVDAAANSEMQTVAAEEPAGVLLLAKTSPNSPEGARLPSTSTLPCPPDCLFPAAIPHLPLTPVFSLACILTLPFAG